MFELIVGFIILVCLLLIAVVMVQKPKGGGLSSAFGGGGGSSLGTQSTNTFLDKTTWTLAVMLMLLVLVSNKVITTGSEVRSNFENKVDLTTQEQAAPPVTETGAEAPAQEAE